ncbi:hypothetical protein CL633_01550 [bacterium]|nr:hypothetical protein [bacterium]|tara:strand:+ start:4197 stop:5117 length:921 start_codon:yes stop_codon:yes gene_type:complete
MSSIFKQINLNKIKRYSIKNRKHKVSLKDLVYFDDECKPDQRKISRNMKEFASLIKQARENLRAIVFGLGGHVIKTGMSPLLIELIRRGFITCIAGNGSVAIHDFELSAFGRTSEYVEDNLLKGKFGMVQETGKLFHQALKFGFKNKLGFGEALGRYMHKHPEQFPHKDISLLYNAYKNKIPLTVHTAIGAETIYQHPECNGARIGELSFRDFKIFSHQLFNLNNRGVYLNIGSAVIMPEVFLKALTVAKNIKKVRNFYTANFDMIDHYRPRVNVVERPMQDQGRGFQCIGKHEEQIPKLASILLS